MSVMMFASIVANEWAIRADGLETSRLEPQVAQLVGQVDSRGITGAARPDARIEPKSDLPAKKGSGRQDNRPSAKPAAVPADDTVDSVCCY